MRKHYAAVKARLEASPVLAGKVHNTIATDAAGVPIRTSYVILFGGSPDVLDDDRLTSEQSTDSDAEYLYTVRAVGANADAALATADVVKGQLIGFAPTISGRSCPAMWLDDGSDVEPDVSIKPPLFYIDLEFGLKSNRA